MPGGLPSGPRSPVAHTPSRGSVAAPTATPGLRRGRRRRPLQSRGGGVFDGGGDVGRGEKPCSPGPMSRQRACFQLPPIPCFGVVQSASADRDRVGRLVRGRHRIRGVLKIRGVWGLVSRHTGTFRML